MLEEHLECTDMVDAFFLFLILEERGFGRGCFLSQRMISKAFFASFLSFHHLFFLLALSRSLDENGRNTIVVRKV